VSIPVTQLQEPQIHLEPSWTYEIRTEALREHTLPTQQMKHARKSVSSDIEDKSQPFSEYMNVMTTEDEDF